MMSCVKNRRWKSSRVTSPLSLLSFPSTLTVDLPRLENFRLREFEGDVTRDDSQRRFLEQHSITTLLRHCFEWSEHCSNIATMCCA